MINVYIIISHLSVCMCTILFQLISNSPDSLYIILPRFFLKFRTKITHMDIDSIILINVCIVPYGFIEICLGKGLLRILHHYGEKQHLFRCKLDRISLKADCIICLAVLKLSV